MKELLVVNTKAYLEGTGQKALRLARICKRLSAGARAELILSVQPSDIPGVSGHVTTFAQHIDAIGPGSHTGHILPEAVKAAGAKGTLINHSERRLALPEIKERIMISRKTGLRVVCCVPRTGMVRDVARMNPDYIAIEPPELIGTGIPVSRARPGVITRSVGIAKKANSRVRVLCGAGISKCEDVEKALELGASGVLVASGIVKAP
ncbi:MAG: triose-phosphate isomerase, partial [Candidatus Aenigmarchaeota archaeon]|nr:triose-phosphate isomerase [Candidatus Aenigmarchaeota archaeon]